MLNFSMYLFAGYEIDILPAGIYLLKVNNRSTEQGVKYVQS